MTVSPFFTLQSSNCLRKRAGMLAGLIACPAMMVSCECLLHELPDCDVERFWELDKRPMTCPVNRNVVRAGNGIRDFAVQRRWRDLVCGAADHPRRHPDLGEVRKDIGGAHHAGGLRKP